MRTSLRSAFAVGLLACFIASASVFAATLSTDKAPVLAKIPAGLKATEDALLKDQLVEIATLRNTFSAAMEEYNGTPRTGIVVGSAQEAILNLKITQVNQARANYIEAVKFFNHDVAIIAEEIRVIAAMNAYTCQFDGWSDEKKSRIAVALNSLGPDKAPDATPSIIQDTWRQIFARDPAKGFAAEAAAGDGPGFPGAGTQSHEDCAVFALANATGRPYGLVAASAADLIGKAEWRTADQRKAPEQAIASGGLNGGEVIILAETFGQATVVTSTDFPKTLQEGHRILVNSVPASGNINAGHEIVLTKSFKHEGETWFTVMDSNQAPDKLLYVSTRELNIILKENGVIYQPEPNSTAPLLRDPKE